MAEFRYVAKDDDGQERCGTILAEDRSSALAAIRDQGLIPLAIGEVRGGGSSGRAKRTKKKPGSPWGVGTLVAGVVCLFISLVPCAGIFAKYWSYPTIVLGIIGILVSVAKKRKDQVVCGVIGLAFCFVGLKIALKQEVIVNEAFNDLNKTLDESSKELRNAAQRASEDSKSADGIIGALDEGIKALDRLDSGVREIKKGIKEFDRGMKEMGQRVKSTDKSSKGFDLGSMVDFAGKAVKEVDVDQVMDVAGKAIKEVDVDKVMDFAGKAIKEVDVDKVMDVAGKVVKEVDVEKVMDVAGKAVKEIDLDKVMEAADKGIQEMDQIARSLNGNNDALGAEEPLTKEQIKEKIQKWQNGRWKKDVIEYVQSEKGTVSASDLAEKCETAELQPVMDQLVADYALLVNGLDAYAAASDETAALKAFTSSISASDLAKIRDDGAKLKDALNDLREKTSLSDLSRIKTLASDGMKVGKLALSVGNVCGVVKRLLAEAPQD